MDRYQARFAKLALTDHQHPRLPIDVRIVEAQGLTDTEAGGREQTEQRGVGPVPQSFAGGKFPGHLEQSRDLLVGIEVWVLAMTPRREKISRRDLGPWIAGLVMDGEIANDPKPPGRPGRRCAGGHGAGMRQVRREGKGPLGTAAREEGTERQHDTKLPSPKPTSWSSNPRPRRRLKYSSTACLKVVMTPPPATAGRGPARPRRRPWRRSAWSQDDGGARCPRFLGVKRRVARGRSPRNDATDGPRAVAGSGRPV